MRYTIATQFIRHDLPRSFAVRPEQLSEESFRRLGVPARLQIHINDIAVLIHCSPQVETSTFDRDEYLVDEERVAKSGVFAFQPFRKQRTRFLAPQSNQLVTHFDAALREEVFDVVVPEIEPVVGPDGVLNDHWRKSAPFVEIG
jgi:hypothetical protein